MADSAGALNCPHCKTAMIVVSLGQAHFSECPQCHGNWVGHGTLETISTDREQQAIVLQSDAEPQAVPFSDEVKIRYLPCPVCRELMHRVNFAKYSMVVLDSCNAHGAWFDRGELHRLIRFFAANGQELARQKEAARLKAQRRLRQFKNSILSKPIRPIDYPI